ncbi:MAG: hypothetical protein ABMA26_10925 [Limisphaerales bacterium]
MEANIPTAPPEPVREPMRPWVKALLLIVSLIVVAVLGLRMEDLRAQKELAAYRAHLVASGEKLDLVAHIPTLPPASSNGAASFMVAPQFTRLPFWLVLQYPVAPGRACVAWQREKQVNAETNIWPMMTAHLVTNRAAVAAIRAALEYPELLFNPDYGKGFEARLPHLERIRESAWQLAHAAVTTMQARDKQGALDHLLTGVRLTGRFREPIHISQLIRTSYSRELLKATWELLQAPDWSDEQLAALQGAWQEWKLLDDWLAAAQVERTTFSAAFARCRAEPALLVGDCLCSGEPSWDCRQVKAQRFASAHVWKLGFSHRDELWSLRQHQRHVEHLRGIAATDNGLPHGKEFDLPPMPSGSRVHVLSGMQSPGFGSSVLKLATFETARRITTTAVALHRHRQRHKEFPASLAELVPDFLSEAPHDFMDGQPLRYRRTAEGQFWLWSVGSDSKDDGGDPTSLAGKPVNWLFGRDWVWPQAATQAEVDAYHAARAAERAAQLTSNR